MDGVQYLVAPYSKASSWVKNLEAKPEAVLTRGSSARAIRCSGSAVTKLPGWLPSITNESPLPVLT